MIARLIDTPNTKKIYQHVHKSVDIRKISKCTWRLKDSWTDRPVIIQVDRSINASICEPIDRSLVEPVDRSEDDQ